MYGAILVIWNTFKLQATELFAMLAISVVLYIM